MNTSQKILSFEQSQKLQINDILNSPKKRGSEARSKRRSLVSAKPKLQKSEVNIEDNLLDQNLREDMISTFDED
jgi:hypothetical protein